MSQAWSVFLFLRKNRIKKKQKLYNLALGVAFDWTISIYVGFYIVVLMAMVYDAVSQFENWFYSIEQLADQWIPLMVVALMVRTIILSFHSPGISFSSADWKAATLPILRQYVWLFTYFEAILKTVIWSFGLFLLAFILTPLSTGFLLKCLMILILTNCLLLLPQWYLYQIEGKKKVIIFLLVTVMLAIIRFVYLFVLPFEGFLYSLLAIIFSFNLVIWNKRLEKINWQSVIEVVDTKIWSMFFIQKMSKTETKPVQKPILPALFRSAKEKLPFPYHHETMIYRKLWKINFRQEKAYFVQTLGVSIICLVLLSFRGDLVQGVSVAIAIFLFNKMSTSYFQAGFKDRLLHAIPWDMKAIKKAYLQRMTVFMGLIMVVLATLLVITEHLSIWVFLQLLLYGTSLYVLLELKLHITVKKMNDKWYTPTILEQLISPIIYILLISSFAYNLVSIFVIILLLYFFLPKKAI
ncbi:MULTISPECIES: hypothetical protein [Gracilibacillus]|uniref:Uncharacterized protein n=1 Tax=Gracilibacillus dipsosauri TaxID=178340 RepID=A0A317KXK4_9BACI|nr:hypothetical protein [Gracilibacillus dipsosauri]PWU68053.1 hypothetical protein DLJ74_13235 [Gracilibacillus dipsosauri]